LKGRIFSLLEVVPTI